MMKKISTLFFVALAVFSLNSMAQTIIDFETEGAGYTPSATEGSGDIDVFNRSNPNIGGNSTYIWAVEDINLTNPYIDLDQIDVTGASSFTFSIDMIAHHYNDWDNNEELLITYSLDGGTYQNLMWVQNTGEQYNDPAALDTDFDGDGECAYVLPSLTTGTGTDGCVVSSNVFETFSTAAIPLSGNTTLDINLQFNQFTSADEGIYLDNITITPAFGGNNPPVISNVVQTPTEDIEALVTTVSVSAEVTDTDGSVDIVELNWGTASGMLFNSINMSNTGGDTYTTDTDIPAQAAGTTVFYEIYAEDNIGDGSTSSEFSYSVIEAQTTTLPYFETFDADLGQCYTKNVSGATKEWYWGNYGGNGYANMNGYNSGDTETDWLILPGVNLDAYSNEYLTFDTWYNYGSDDANNYLKLYYSTDYPGLGDPTSYTWVEVAFTQGAISTWTNSGLLDISGITGTSVYFGFKYNYEIGNYRQWEVDNIAMFEAALVNVSFQVNMSEQSVSGLGVHVAGNFNGWNPSATQMYDDGLTGGDLNAGDGIYTVTLPLYQGLEYEFKYINGNAWGMEESVPAECQKPGTSNRYEVVGGSDYYVPVVCFSSCADCGTPDWNVTFRVDMKNETVTGDVYLAGDFNSWSDQVMTNTSGTVYEATVLLEEGSYHEYKFKNGTGGWESFIGSCVVADYGNRFMTSPIGGDAILDLVCFNSCEACPVADFVMINEVDADTPGTDAVEFIELYDGGVGNTDLSGLVVVLFNGSDDQSYNTAIDLDGYSTDANGYFVIGSATVPNVDYAFFTTNGIQNGADAVALFIGDDTDFPNDTPITTVNLIDALVYDTNDGDDAGLLVLLNAGEPQINEGGRGDNAAHSNQRIPNGSGGLLNTSTYDQATPTPGAVNVAEFNDWTGALSSDWFDAGNWQNGAPSASLNAVIPDVSGASNTYPVINAAGAVANDLVVQSGATLTIAPAGQLNVNGFLSNSNGAAGIVLQADASGQGSLITDDATYMTVQTYLSAGQWHGVSAPVSGDTAGVYTGVWLLEHAENDGSWTYIVPVETPMPQGKGYFAWAEGSSYTANHVGVIQVSDLAYTLSYTNPHPITGQEGWNLVGNPFTSAVQWNTNWTLNNMDATMYIYDNGNYYTMNTSGAGTLASADIPVGQGFFVRANAASPSMTFPASERLHSTTGFYKSDVSGLINFSVTGNGLEDKMIVQFTDEASNAFDTQFDAYKLKGDAGVPQLYMNFNGAEMSFNALPFSDEVVIPVNFEAGNDGTFTLNVSYGENVVIILEDLLKGEFIELNSGDEYTFDASVDDATERFVLHFAGVNTVDELSTSDFIVYAHNNTVYIKSDEMINGQVEVYDVMGRNILTTKVSGSNFYNLPIDANHGHYIIKITNDTETISQKLRIF